MLFPVARSIIMAVVKNVIVQKSLSITCYNQAEVRSKVELGVHCGKDNGCMAVSSDIKGGYPSTKCDCSTNPAAPIILEAELASVLHVRLYEVQLAGNHQCTPW